VQTTEPTSAGAKLALPGRPNSLPPPADNDMGSEAAFPRELSRRLLFDYDSYGSPSRLHRPPSTKLAAISHLSIPPSDSSSGILRRVVVRAERNLAPARTAPLPGNRTGHSRVQASRLRVNQPRPREAVLAGGYESCWQAKSAAPILARPLDTSATDSRSSFPSLFQDRVSANMTPPLLVPPRARPPHEGQRKDKSLVPPQP